MPASMGGANRVFCLSGFESIEFNQLKEYKVVYHGQGIQTQFTGVNNLIQN
jgi:hypothetical protein